MTDESLDAPSRSAHRAAAEPTSNDLDPEVEQTWVRPRGRDRYAPGSGRADGSRDSSDVRDTREAADITDTAAHLEPLVRPRSAFSAVSRETTGQPRLSGRRASESASPEAAAAERLAADRAAVAAQAEALLRRAEERRREAQAVRPRPAIQSPTQHLVVEPPRGPERRLVAGGVFDGPLEESALHDRQAERQRRAAHETTAALPAPAPAPAPAPGFRADPREAAADVATRAIAVVREAGPGPTVAADTSRPSAKFVPDRTLVMGILNVTLDSFSDGGRYSRFDDAIAHARSLVADGADIIDVGGESTRPGAPRVEVHEEQRRVIPVIRELVDMGLRVSIDTMNAATAFAAVEAGANIINDVSGGLADVNMATVAADTDKTFVAMHWRGHSTVMERNADYGDVVKEVKSELFQRVAELVVLGVNPDRLVIDPGLGFAKRGDDNWSLLGHFDEFAELGLPVLVAASRKRFLGALLREDAGVLERDPATAVISALSAQAGAWAVRVHDVASTRAALDVWQAWQKGSR